MDATATRDAWTFVDCEESADHVYLRSTRARPVAGGLLVLVTTTLLESGSTLQSLAFVPGAAVEVDDDGTARLV